MPNWQIPFDPDGNQQHYPGPSFVSASRRITRIEPTMLDNFEFNDTLTYEGYRRGRSAAYFVWKRQNGKKVTMFLKDLDESIQHIVNGTLSGTFTFTKRGANFGVKLVKV